MKFYEFTQNNSGGNFITDDDVCHRLLIEAGDVDEATEKALELGVYFDGVESGIDCDCCGDRWRRPWSEDPLEFPMEYESYRIGKVSFGDAVEYAQLMADEYGWTSPDARIFYKDGTVKEIFTKEK